MSRNTDMATLHVTKKWTMQQIAEKYGVSRERVRQILTEQGVNRTQAEAQSLRREYARNDNSQHHDVWLAAYRETRSIQDVAVQFGRSTTTIYSVIGDSITEADRRSKKPAGKEFSDEDCRVALRRAHEHYGEDVYLSAARYRYWARTQVGVPGDQTIFLRFGGWANALAEIGLVGKPRQVAGGWAKKLYSDEDIIAELAYVQKKVKRLPTVYEYDVHRRKKSPSAATVRNRFGSWSNALLKLEGITQ